MAKFLQNKYEINLIFKDELIKWARDYAKPPEEEPEDQKKKKPAKKKGNDEEEEVDEELKKLGEQVLKFDEQE